MKKVLKLMKSEKRNLLRFFPYFKFSLECVAFSPVILTTASLAVFACFESANAAVLISYEFTAASLSATIKDPNVSSPDPFGAGTGLTGGNPTHFGTSAYGFPSAGISVRSSGTTDTLAGAVAANDYIGFTITAAAGYKLNLEQLTFNLVWSTNDTNQDFSLRQVALRTSLDGFAATVGTEFTAFDAGKDNGVAPDQGEWELKNVDLSAAGFQNLTAPLEIRFYAYDNCSSSGNVFRFDNISLEGATALIPEPSTSLLIGVGVVVGLMRRRK